MECCDAEMKQRRRGRRLGSASGSIGSGVLLVLLPKCPMCLAAYLALWTGASAVMPAVTLIRPLLEVIFAVSVILLLARSLRMHARG